MNRFVWIVIAGTTCFALGCGSRSIGRSVCDQDAECIELCRDFGHPAESARCGPEGTCVCEDPADVVGDNPDTSDAPADVATDLDTTDPDTTDLDTTDLGDDADMSETSDASDMSDLPPSACPVGMIDLGNVCMDRYEAPNADNALPLVMYTFDEAEAWCADRNKRLCFDDEWTQACGGADNAAYPYGNTHEPGRCNDDKIWRVYSQSRLSNWPLGVSTPDIQSLEALLQSARDQGAAGSDAADHIADLYQGEAGGQNPLCTNETGVQDLVGNVEEWTRRRDGGSGAQFHGNLKGRYWAESRTCQSNVTTHGDGFRFYEIGFRCCAERMF